MPASNEEAITGALELLGSDIGETKRGWVHASCPLAAWRHEGGVDKNPSFGVAYNSAEAQKPEGHAHCFSCGYSGDIREIASLQYAFNLISSDILEDVMALLEQVEKHALPLSLSVQNHDDPFIDTEWFTKNFVPFMEAPEAQGYLAERGLDFQTCEHFGLMYDPKRLRVVIPLRDRAQRWRGAIGRTILKDTQGPRYYYYPYPHVNGNSPRGFTWFNEFDLDLSKPVMVVEGVFDALKVWPVYRNVVASLSVSFRAPGLGWHVSTKRWITMFDVGKGGTLARDRLNKLVPEGARVWHLPPPEGRDDPGDATPEEIKAALATLK